MEIIDNTYKLQSRYNETCGWEDSTTMGKDVDSARALLTEKKRLGNWGKNNRLIASVVIDQGNDEHDRYAKGRKLADCRAYAREELERQLQTEFGEEYTRLD